MYIDIKRKGPEDMCGHVVEERADVLSLAEWVADKGRLPSSFRIVAIETAESEFKEGAEELAELDKARKEGYTHVVVEDNISSLEPELHAYYGYDDMEIHIGDGDHIRVEYTAETNIPTE